MPTLVEQKDLIAQAFVAAARRVDGVRNSRDHEPEKLPKLPAVTLLWVRGTQRPVALGPIYEYVCLWRVNVYVPLTAWAEAQQRLGDLSLALMAIVRADRTLAGSCDEATLDDDGEEPERSPGDSGRWARNGLLLTAVFDGPA